MFKPFICFKRCIRFNRGFLTLRHGQIFFALEIHIVCRAGDFGRIHTRKENFCCLFLRKTAGLRYHQILGRILQYIPIPFIDRYCVTKKGGKER